VTTVHVTIICEIVAYQCFLPFSQGISNPIAMSWHQLIDADLYSRVRVALANQAELQDHRADKIHSLSHPPPSRDRSMHDGLGTLLDWQVRTLHFALFWIAHRATRLTPTADGKERFLMSITDIEHWMFIPSG
jgi:hypothetical protein